MEAFWIAFTAVLSVAVLASLLWRNPASRRVDTKLEDLRAFDTELDEKAAVLDRRLEDLASAVQRIETIRNSSRNQDPGAGSLPPSRDRARLERAFFETMATLFALHEAGRLGNWLLSSGLTIRLSGSPDGSPGHLFRVRVPRCWRHPRILPGRLLHH